MTINWNALLLVAVTTVVAALAIVGVFSLGVAALTSGEARTAGGRPSAGARLAGYACIGVSGLLVLYGLYLIVPQFH